MRTPLLRCTVLSVAIGSLLASPAQAADWNGSYIANGQCFCSGAPDGSIGDQLVPTPIGSQSVTQICDRIGAGPKLVKTDGVFNYPVYADPQCGHGPFPGDSIQDATCSGAHEPGVDCQSAGPNWSLQSLYETPEVEQEITTARVPVTGGSRYVDPSAFRANDETAQEQVTIIEGVEVVTTENESDRQQRIDEDKAAAKETATSEEAQIMARQQKELEDQRQKEWQQASSESTGIAPEVAAIDQPASEELNETSAVVVAQAEEAKLAEQTRIAAEEAKLAEQTRIAAEAKLAAQTLIVKEAKLAEQTRIAEETKLVEQSRVAKEAKLAEQAQVTKEAKLAEQAQVTKEAKLAEQARVTKEAKLAEQARVTKEAKLAEQARVTKEAKLAEQARVTKEAKLAEQARVTKEAKLAEQARVAEEAKLAEQARVTKEAKLAEQARVAEEAKLAEQARVTEEAKLAEQARVTKEAKLAEQTRVAEEADERSVAAVAETTEDSSQLAPIAALQLPAGIETNYNDFEYVQALPLGYDFGGGGMAVSGSYSSHGKWHYVGRAGVADTYNELFVGAGYYLTPPNATRMTVVATAGLEYGRFQLTSGELEADDSDSGVALSIASRIAINRFLELQAGVGYSSFFDGDIHFLGGGFVRINKQLDLTSQFEIGDNDSFGLGIRYYY